MVKRILILLAALAAFAGYVYIDSLKKEKGLEQAALHGGLSQEDIQGLAAPAATGNIWACRTMGLHWRAVSKRGQIYNAGTLRGADLAACLAGSGQVGDAALAVQLWLADLGCGALDVTRFQDTLKALGGMSLVGALEAKQVAQCSARST
jgi:hypothetical protein